MNIITCEIISQEVVKNHYKYTNSKSNKRNQLYREIIVSDCAIQKIRDIHT